MPTACTTGTSTGTRISIAAIASMKQPTTSSSTLIAIRIAIGLSEIDEIQVAMARGRPLIAIR